MGLNDFSNNAYCSGNLAVAFEAEKKSIISNKRIDSLQVLRAMAFIGIYLYHAINTFPGEGRLYNFFATSPGRWGVSVFLVLSGFLMTYSYWDRPQKVSVKECLFFAIRKVSRLYPLHIFMLVFGVAYSLWQKQKLAKVIIKFVLTVTLMQTWFPTGYQAINSVAWYLSVTMFLYFCFPVLLKYLKKVNNEKVLASIIIAIYAIQVMIGYCVCNYTEVDIKWIVYCHPIYRLGDFTIGCIWGSLFRAKIQATTRQSQRYFSVMEAIAVVVNIIACVCCAHIPVNMHWFRHTCLFVPSSIFLIYTFAFNKGFISKILSNKVVLWIAGISPYAFLIHRLAILYFHAFIVFVFDTDRISLFYSISIPFIITITLVYLYLNIVKVNEKAKLSSNLKSRHFIPRIMS